MHSGHPTAKTPAIRCQLHKHTPSIMLGTGSVNEAFLNEAAHDSMARTVGDKQLLGEVAHTHRLAMAMHLMQGVVVIERMTARTAETGIHRCRCDAMKPNESFPGGQGARCSHQGTILGSRSYFHSEIYC